MATLGQVLPVALPLTVGLALGALVFIVHRTAQGRVHNHVFAALFGASALKSLADGILPVAGRLHAAAPAFPDAALWFDVSIVCLAAMVPLLLLFVTVFPHAPPALARRPGLALLYFLPSLLFLAFYFLPHGTAPFRRFDLLVALNAASATAVLAALAVVAQRRTRSVDAVERVRLHYMLGVFAVYAAGTLLLAGPFLALALHLPVQVPNATWAVIVAPILELVAASVIAYAILKYQLLGVELHVKHGTRYVLTTTSFFLLLFTTNAAVEELLIEPFFEFTQVGFLFAAAAGALLFRPLERVSQSVTNRLFPATTVDPEAYLRARARDIYHAQVTYVLRDLEVRERERRFLDNLREELKLGADEATRIEREAFRVLAAPA